MHEAEGFDWSCLELRKLVGAMYHTLHREKLTRYMLRAVLGTVLTVMQHAYPIAPPTHALMTIRLPSCAALCADTGYFPTLQYARYATLSSLKRVLIRHTAGKGCQCERETTCK